MILLSKFEIDLLYHERKKHPKIMIEKVAVFNTLQPQLFIRLPVANLQDLVISNQ